MLQKYKANKNTSKHNPKNKKVNNQQKSGKDPMQKDHSYNVTINDNK